MSIVVVASIIGQFAFVGWFEPIPFFFGFLCTQPNLHFAGVIANCITQQRPISEPSPKRFFSIRLAFLGPAAALTFESLAIATAAKNSGKFVVVQVERIADRGTLNACQVKIPGITDMV